MLGTVEVPSSDAKRYEYGAAVVVAGFSEPWKPSGRFTLPVAVKAFALVSSVRVRATAQHQQPKFSSPRLAMGRR